jgi:hypothetical protein
MSRRQSPHPALLDSESEFVINHMCCNQQNPRKASSVRGMSLCTTPYSSETRNYRISISCFQLSASGWRQLHRVHTSTTRTDRVLITHFFPDVRSPSLPAGGVYICLLSLPDKLYNMYYLFNNNSVIKIPSSVLTFSHALITLPRSVA